MNKTAVILIILALIAVNLIQYRGCKEEVVAPPRIDTVTKYVEIHDTFYSKPKYIKGETDTLWMVDVEYLPDTNYPKLLEQYISLGNKHFSKNIYSTKFPIHYGTITVNDTVFSNKSIGVGLSIDVVFPEKTITIVKPAPLKKEFYVGSIVTVGNKLSGNSINIAGLYKDKKNRIFGTSVGWNGNLQIGMSTYIQIK